MSDVSSYVNTFSMISFRFNDPRSSVKYEYFIEDETQNGSSQQSSLLGNRKSTDILIEPTNRYEDDEKDDAITTYWIVSRDGEFQIDTMTRRLK